MQKDVNYDPAARQLICNKSIFFLIPISATVTVPAYSDHFRLPFITSNLEFYFNLTCLFTYFLQEPAHFIKRCVH